MTREYLRKNYEHISCDGIEMTLEQINRVAVWDEDDPEWVPSWAEWGYVRWLEDQIISANRQDHTRNEGSEE